MKFEIENIILKKTSINEKNIHSDYFLDVSYGVDRNFLFGAAISITSLIINNKKINFRFHIFTDYINDDYIERSRELSKKFNTIIEIYLIDSSYLKELPSKKWPLATYFRFIIFKLLSSTISKLLYLDADIICKGPVNDLLKINLDNKFACVVPDIEPMQALAAERLEVEEINGLYFNAGFLYINLDEWEKHGLTEKAISLLSDPIKGKNLKYQDQDVLNLFFLKRTIILPRKFNCIYSIKSELKDKTHQKYKEIITEESIFIHYVGATKPWHSWSTYPSTYFFQKAHIESTWDNVPLLEPITALQWKKKSKHEFKRNEFLKGIISRLLYYKIK